MGFGLFFRRSGIRGKLFHVPFLDVSFRRLNAACNVSVIGMSWASRVVRSTGCQGDLQEPQSIEISILLLNFSSRELTFWFRELKFSSRERTFSQIWFQNQDFYMLAFL